MGLCFRLADELILIACFNNSYLEGKKNRKRLKLIDKKKKVAPTHISQNNRGIFDHIHGLCNIHVFVCVQT